MTWLQEWKAIAARIDALSQVTSFHCQLTSGIGDNYGVFGGNIIPACHALLEDLTIFFKRYEPFVPPGARPVLARLISELTDRRTHSQTGGRAGVQGWIVPLSIFRSEFEFHLRDVSAVVRNLVVRAFLHLQRLLIADRSFRTVWLQAFRKKEPACESLGAVHLLAHGIWAFKVSAAGERTDLVLGTRLAFNAEVEAASEGLVLTEWKLVRKSADTRKKADEAVRQMHLYSENSLAGFELTTDRYAVLVSRDRLPNLPENFKEDGITYHHINVAVEPSVPSRVVRRREEPEV